MRADRRVRGGLAGLAECRAHQRPDLRGGDGIARRLHVGGPRRPEEICRRAAASSTTRSSSSSTPGSASVRPEHAAQFKPFAERIRQFHRIPQGAGAARHRGRPGRRPRVGRQRRQPHRPHGAEQGPRELGALYAEHARDDLRQDRRRHRLHRLADERARRAGVLLAAVGALDHPARRGPAARRDHARHRAGRRGRARSPVPYGSRRDEIGALSRSISVFQHAMQHNKELNRTMAEDAEAREQRQEHLSAEIAAFTPSIEATSPSSAPSAIRCWSSASHLADAADRAVAPHRRRDRPPRPKPPPMCATSPRRPTSLPPR